MGDITELLSRAREGDSRALDSVFDALYEDLRQIARSRLRTHPRDVLLDTAGVVNDCYLRFAKTHRVTPVDRNHFLAYCSQAMRSVIVDMIRSSRRERRGGKAFHTVIPPFLVGLRSRHHAAMASRCFGVIPPRAMFGRS